MAVATVFHPDPQIDAEIRVEVHLGVIVDRVAGYPEGQCSDCGAANNAYLRLHCRFCGAILADSKLLPENQND